MAIVRTQPDRELLAIRHLQSCLRSPRSDHAAVRRELERVRYIRWRRRHLLPYAAITRVQSDQVAGGGSAQTSISSNALNVTAGNLLFIGVRQSGGLVPPVITDTANNTWIFLNGQDISNIGADCINMWYAKNITGNASNVIKATFSGSVGGVETFPAIITHEYSGCDPTSPLDANPTAVNSAGVSQSSITSNSFTTAQANEVLVAFAGTNSLTSTYVAGSGYAIVQTSGDLDAASEDQIVSSIQTGVTASMSVSSGTVLWAIGVATFKAASFDPATFPKAPDPNVRAQFPNRVLRLY